MFINNIFKTCIEYKQSKQLIKLTYLFFMKKSKVETRSLLCCLTEFFAYFFHIPFFINTMTKSLNHQRMQYFDGSKLERSKTASRPPSDCTIRPSIAAKAKPKQ